MTFKHTDTPEKVEEAGIGHNNPPENPFETLQNGVNDLYDEAKLWLDGEPITTQKQADSLALLDDQIKKAAKDLETLRKEEKKPHDDAAKAVQAKFKPLMEKANKAREVLNEALRPFMLAKKREQEEAARKVREEADRKQKEAVAALQASSLDNLAEREAAEQKLKEAKTAAKEAKQAEKARPNVKGEGRAKTIVTTYEAVVVDAVAATRFLWGWYPQAYTDLTKELSQKRVNDGFRDIPGVEVKEIEKVRG